LSIAPFEDPVSLPTTYSSPRAIHKPHTII
jgi:hypothetical protein